MEVVVVEIVVREFVVKGYLIVFEVGVDVVVGMGRLVFVIVIGGFVMVVVFVVVDMFFMVDCIGDVFEFVEFYRIFRGVLFCFFVGGIWIF